MEEKILGCDKKGLEAAGKNIVCLTFLTGTYDKKGLFYLACELGLYIGKLWPGTKVYLFKYQQQEGGGPGYEMKISLIPIKELKVLCMKMEYHNGKRVADIDVFTYDDGRLTKISCKSPGEQCPALLEQ